MAAFFLGVAFLAAAFLTVGFGCGAVDFVTLPLLVLPKTTAGFSTTAGAARGLLALAFGLEAAAFAFGAGAAGVFFGLPTAFFGAAAAFLAAAAVVFFGAAAFCETVSKEVKVLIGVVSLPSRRPLA